MLAVYRKIYKKTPLLENIIQRDKGGLGCRRRWWLAGVHLRSDMFAPIDTTRDSSGLLYALRPKPGDAQMDLFEWD